VRALRRSKRNIVIGGKIDGAKQQRAIELRRSMTPEEQLLWERLRRNSLDGLHFRRQQVIEGFIVDFYCHAVGLVVEVDGAMHEETYDAERDNVLEAREISVLRFRNDRLREDIEGVLADISRAAADRFTRSQ
jgi:very-short-patch-repair endonuclease